ncbi:MAG: hypothetical protein VSS75_005825 [Candidatus Parabeggiatoa sp.]|nr:hypothetical protein [Candidatus Parabeggiatoa sp.]
MKPFWILLILFFSVFWNQVSALNIQAITPFYEIAPQAKHRIMAMALSENGVCWIETVTPAQLRMDKWLEQVSPIQIKALEYHKGEAQERLVWQDNSAVGNTIYAYQMGNGFLSLTYTHLDLIPRTETMTVALQNQHWGITNRSQAFSPIDSLSLPFEENNEVILPSFYPIVKYFRFTEKQLEIAVSAKVGMNTVRFALPLPQVFSTEIGAHFERQQRLGYLKTQANLNQQTLVWGEQNNPVVFFMAAFNRLLIKALENYVAGLSYQAEGINQINAVKFFNLMRLWRDKDEWTVAQQLDIDRFLARQSDQLKNSLLVIPVADSRFSLLFSAWHHLAWVVPEHSQINVRGSVHVLEQPSLKTVYYLKGSLPDFIPTSQETKQINAWIKGQLATTPRLVTKIPPVSTIGLSSLPDSLASLEITPLHIEDHHIILIARLDSREAGIFENMLTEGTVLEMRLNTETLGFESKTQPIIPLALEVKKEVMTRRVIDKNYSIKIIVNREKLESFFDYDKSPMIEVNYQGRIKTLPLFLDKTDYTIEYPLKRDINNDPIYRFLWRMPDNRTTSWEKADMPFVLISLSESNKLKP